MVGNYGGYSSERPPAVSSHSTWAAARPTAPNPALAEIRRITTAAGGVLRTGEQLRAALDELSPHRDTEAGLVAWLLIWSALQRTESRGAHTRVDFPDPHPAAVHTTVGAPVTRAESAA